MENIINYLVDLMLLKKIIIYKQISIIKYGLDLFFSSIITLSSLVLIAFIRRKLLITLLLLLFFIPLQSFGGGYHCKTHLRCWLLMMSGYLVSVFIGLNIPIRVLYIGAWGCAYVFIKYAPVENIKAPFSSTFYKKMRKIVLVIYAVAMFMAHVLWQLNVECSIMILNAVILSGISIWSASRQQEQDNIEFEKIIKNKKNKM